MNGEKRVRQIAIRITDETYKQLEIEANKLKWSIAKTANEIIEEWIRQNKNSGGSINLIIHNNQNININGK